MSYDIVTLVPTCYTKKSKRATNDFKDTDEFVEMLQKKFNEWNINGYFETKVGLAYKVRYDQIHRQFLTKCSLLLYVVDSSSEETFRACLTKINTSCQDQDKLKMMAVVTVNGCMVEHDSRIEVVSFKGNLWRCEDDPWKILENFLREKLESNSKKINSIPMVGTSLTLPLPIPRHKSSSKIKSFFNSLPSKFDIEKRKSFKDKSTSEMFNESVPNIKVSGSQEENIMNEINPKDKEDHSKLSLHSFFRKRPRKARDSGLSIDSSNSNGSNSKQSEIMSTSLHETSPTCERSPMICTSSLNKTKYYKAKILMFKDKANQVFHSASCLNSPDNKRRKNVEDVFSEENHFSSLQMPMLSDTNYKESRNINYRGQSEPPMTSSPTPTPKENGIIKYYSWSSDLAKSQEILNNELIYDNKEITSTYLEPTEHIDSYPSIYEDNNDLLETALNLYDVQNDTIQNDNQKLHLMNDKNNIEEKNIENINENYFQINYAPNRENNIVKTTKPSVTFKIDGLDSLENIMESIQKSCDDMKMKTKPNNDNNIVLNTFKGKSENNSQHKEEKLLGNKNNVMESSYEIQKHVSLTCEAGLLKSSEEEIGLEVSDIKDSSSDSVLYRASNLIIKNPFVVMTLLTATAFTAPIWSTYIPYHIRFDQIMALTTSTVNRILNNEMVRSFPTRLFHTVGITATATTQIFLKQRTRVPLRNALFTS